MAVNRGRNSARGTNSSRKPLSIAKFATVDFDVDDKRDPASTFLCGSAVLGPFSLALRQLADVQVQAQADALRYEWCCDRATRLPGGNWGPRRLEGGHSPVQGLVQGACLLAPQPQDNAP